MASSGIASQRSRRRYLPFFGAGFAAFFGVLQQAIRFLLAANVTQRLRLRKRKQDLQALFS
jgi:hypothetical protein